MWEKDLFWHKILRENAYTANKITYEKSKEFLLAEGEVKIVDKDGNILKTDKATYDKINEKIVTYNNTRSKVERRL